MIARNIRAGSAFIELFLNDSRLVRGLRRAESRLRSVGQRFVMIGTAMAGLGTTALVPLKSMADGAAALGDKLHKMSIRTGVTVESLSQLQFAAEQSGTTIDALGDALFRMQRRIGNAALETGPAVRALKELGLEAKSLSKLSTEEQFEAVVGALDRERSRSGKNVADQFGFEIMGDNIKQLVPLLTEGRDGIAQLRQEADSLGKTFSGSAASLAASYTDSVNKAQTAKKALSDTIGVRLLPTLIKFNDRLTDVYKRLQDWVKLNPELIMAYARIAVGVTLAGTAIAGLGVLFLASSVVMAKLLVVIGLVGASIHALGVVVSALVSPLGLVVVSLGVLAAKLLDIRGTAKRLSSEVSSLFEIMKTKSSEALSAITTALADGDLETAGAVLVAALRTGFDEGMGHISVTFEGWKHDFLASWSDLSHEMSRVFAVAFKEKDSVLDRFFTGALGKLGKGAEVFNSMLSWSQERLAGLPNSIDTALLKAFPGVFNPDSPDLIHWMLSPGHGTFSASEYAAALAGTFSGMRLEDRTGFSKSRQELISGFKDREQSREEILQGAIAVLGDDHENKLSTLAADLEAAQKPGMDRIAAAQAEWESVLEGAEESRASSVRQAMLDELMAAAKDAWDKIIANADRNRQDEEGKSAQVRRLQDASAGTFIGQLADRILGAGTTEQTLENSLQVQRRQLEEARAFRKEIVEMNRGFDPAEWGLLLK